MMAGAAPIPAMPRRRSSGTAATSAASGTMSSPKSAMLGVVWRMFRTGMAARRQAGEA